MGLKLYGAIDQLIADLENNDFRSHEELKAVRGDADRVHSEGFYFFNINIHRTMVLVEMDEDGEATIVWAGSHDDYESTFKNNRHTIEKWLRNKGFIN
ncbi:MAG: type II toxin-antitoxin system HigB family toxin [Bacteroidia bacterium]